MNWKMIAGDRTYDMELGPPSFNLCTDNLHYKKLCLFIWRKTQFPNIDWVMVITFSLKFPFIRFTSAFVPEE